jgi:EAL and modified HD-GYP domain-containing signal transduction protein
MSANAHPSNSGSRVFVVRQPVFDRTRRVVGYELLLQPFEAPDATASSLDRTSARVITDGVLTIGLDHLVAGRLAFLTVSRRLLTSGLPELRPQNRVVLQLASDIEADAEVVEACRALRAEGYQLAIDDFTFTPWIADLLPLVQYVKAGVQGIDAVTRSKVLADQAAGGPAFIAKDVDSALVFDAMAEVGCRFFQGGFLGEPTVKHGRTVPAQQLMYLRLLRALNDPNLSVHELGELVKHDAALCVRILQTVNSAGFGLRTTVSSIHDALILLGRDPIRRWASLWAVAALGDRAHNELILMATMRGRCCEVLGDAISDELGGQGFLLGLCSLLGAILERPMAEILSGLPVDPDVRRALLGTDNRLSRLLSSVVAYERGRWDVALAAAKTAGLDPRLLPVAYQDALSWSRRFEQQRAA